MGRAARCRNCRASSQPAIGQPFPLEAPGRALTAYNQVGFEGVFCIQWGIGLVIDSFRGLGWAIQASFRGAFAFLAIGGALARAWFVGPNESIRLSRVGPAP